MARKKNEPDPTVSTALILLYASFVLCALVYALVSPVRTSPAWASESLALDEDKGGCCRGIEMLEFWGTVVKEGSDFKFNNSEGCCNACKSMCSRNYGPCLCDTWVFCGNRHSCGSRFGECWLKKQKDSLAPEQQETGEAGWTSGLIFGKGEGIIGLETEYGTLRVKLFPECAPHSVAYILELLSLYPFAGCQFYRAESRGGSWDSEGNHLKNADFGPPFALIQGTLEAQGSIFKKIPIEHCPPIRRGSVAWVGSGPEFFVSLANHREWKKEYTVFGSVLPEDLHIAERISMLPTRFEVWNNINVSVLEKFVPLMLRKIEKSREDFNTSNFSLK